MIHPGLEAHFKATAFIGNCNDLPECIYGPPSLLKSAANQFAENSIKKLPAGNIPHCYLFIANDSISDEISSTIKKNRLTVANLGNVRCQNGSPLSISCEVYMSIVCLKMIFHQKLGFWN